MSEPLGFDSKGHPVYMNDFVVTKAGTFCQAVGKKFGGHNAILEIFGEGSRISIPFRFVTLAYSTEVHQ